MVMVKSLQTIAKYARPFVKIMNIILIKSGGIHDSFKAFVIG
jgi:hypothetical protein